MSVAYYLDQLDKELNKIEPLNQFQRKTKVPKTYLVLAIFGISLSLIFFNIAPSLITNLLGFVFPTYFSFRAIESHDIEDGKLWTVYWVTFSFFNIIEHFSRWLLASFPLYFFFKLSIMIYLAHPTWKGGAQIYDSFIHPHFAKYHRGPEVASSSSSPAGLSQKGRKGSGPLHEKPMDSPPPILSDLKTPSY